MAHLEPEQLDQALQRLYPGVKLEVPGTAIDAKLLARILAAVTGEDGVPSLDCACFAMVHFTGNAKFANAQFSRDANFAAARFSGETNDPVVRWWRVERALNAWADLPVTCKVRPLVLLGSTILEARAPIDEDAQSTAQREFIRSVSGFPAVLLRAFQYRDMTDRHSGPPHDDVSAGVSALTEIPPRHGSFTQIEEAPEKPNGRSAAQDVESPM
jgi:hypothetical protein